jgi:hypothetical protein
MIEMKIYRGFRYDVRRVDEATWEWNVYVKNENAPRFGGMEKSEYAAERASQDSIDQWIERSN